MSSSLKCSNCNTPIGPRRTKSLLTHHVTECGNCKEKIDHHIVKVETLPSAKKFEDSDYAKKASWWHGTMKERWGKWIRSAPTSSNVHVGTYNAALARRASFIDARPWHVFKVRLREGVEVSDTIHPDSYVNSVEAYPGVAQRYLNIWESPGSISMAVCKSDIEVVEHRLLQPGKWSATVLDN